MIRYSRSPRTYSLLRYHLPDGNLTPGGVRCPRCRTTQELSVGVWSRCSVCEQLFIRRGGRVIAYMPYGTTIDGAWAPPFVIVDTQNPRR